MEHKRHVAPATDAKIDLDVRKLLGFESLDLEQAQETNLEEVVGATLSKIGGEGNQLSDIRLKRNIVDRGSVDGMRLYEFSYIGNEARFTGVMAQDLLDEPSRATAVVKGADGFLRVDYAALGLSHLVTPAMISVGAQAAASARS